MEIVKFQLYATSLHENSPTTAFIWPSVTHGYSKRSSYHPTHWIL